MNLRAIDLNLLVVLRSLLEEAHVSRAAARLGLSQPATSAALERCRHLFGDALLERGRGRMRRTARAEALRAPLAALLDQAEALLLPPALDLRQLRQRLHLVMADHPAARLVGPLQARLEREAPGIDLVIQPWQGAEAALAALAAGRADLAVSVFPPPEAEFRRETLRQEEYRVLMRRDHPAAEGFDLDRWLAWPHLVVSGRGEASSPLDGLLARMGRGRRIGLVVPSFLLAPILLRDSQLIAMLPGGCLPEDMAGFRDFAPPIPVEGFPLHLAWHRRRDADPGTRHVAGLIRTLLSP